MESKTFLDLLGTLISINYYGKDTSIKAGVCYKRKEVKLENSSMALLQPRLVTQFTEEKKMVQDAVWSFTRNDILPLVYQMESNRFIRWSPTIDARLVTSMFNNGFMRLVVSEDYNGANMNFTVTCITVKELSRIYIHLWHYSWMYKIRWASVLFGFGAVEHYKLNHSKILAKSQQSSSYRRYKLSMSLVDIL